MVELMVVVAIVALLLTIGVPSFTSSLRANRVATTTNELLASISLARSEAVRSPGGAWICTTADGTTCGGNWNDGWMIWIDANENDGVAQPTGTGDRIVRHVQGNDAMSVTGSAAAGAEAARSIRFDRRGRVAQDPNGRSFRLEPMNCSGARDMRRTLTLTASGQVSTAKGNCS